MGRKSTKSKRIFLLFNREYRLHDYHKVGIFKYVHPNIPWSFINFDTEDPDFVRKIIDWKPDGGIGDVGTKTLSEAAASIGVPFVNIYGGKPFNDLPQTGVCDRAIGRMAADYFVSLGYRSFGYFGLDGGGFSSGRERGYRERLSELGFTADIFDYRKSYEKVPCTDVLWINEKLYGWIKGLMKPSAIFACDDMRGLWVSDACSTMHLKIPDDVALLGVNNTEAICNEAYPPLSSIEVPAVLAGAEAAKMLHGMLSGQPAPDKPVLFEPEKVFARLSTDTVEISDFHVSKALKFIRENAFKRIKSSDVARHVSLKRGALEKKFRRELMRTPFEEIRRLQIDRIKELLRETRMTLDAIAHETGFKMGIRLNREFKNSTGMTPGEYRRRFGENSLD